MSCGKDFRNRRVFPTAPKGKRLRQSRLQRPMPARQLAASLRLHSLRTRHQTKSPLRPNSQTTRVGDEGPHPRLRPIHRSLPPPPKLISRCGTVTSQTRLLLSRIRASCAKFFCCPSQSSSHPSLFKRSNNLRPSPSPFALANSSTSTTPASSPPGSPAPARTAPSPPSAPI